MKEAAGEANLTVVAIILIGVIVAIATPIVTSMMQNTQDRACCMDAGGMWQGGQCVDASGDAVPYDDDCTSGDTDTANN